ncbi:MAG: eamA [Gammaproteobacteria bacterium]|nr:eamA [Gammaproteobacteria bacterium]
MIHIAVETISPFLLCSLRFFFASVPLIFFIKRPNVPFKTILLYGLLTFALQYTLFFWGMSLGTSAGIASLLYQTNVFFNIFLAACFFKERLSPSQVLGIVIAFSGIGFIGLHLDGKLAGWGFLLIISGAFVWAFGNIVSKKIGKANMLSLVVWGNFISWPPLLLLTYFTEGPRAILFAWQHASFASILAVGYIVYISTLLAFCIWGWLLNRYPVSVVSPFSLLIPVFAMLAAFIILGEPLFYWKIIAAALIMSGLCLNLLSAKFKRRQVEP